MGMVFASDAVYYIEGALNNAFDASATGLVLWQRSTPFAQEFRDALDGSRNKKAAALGSITLEYLNLDIPDSANPNIPASGDPFNGKSYRRWIYFWNKFRRKFPSDYNGLVDEVLQVLENQEPSVKGMIFQATPAHSNSENGVGIQYMQNGGVNYKYFTLITKPWDTV